MKTTCLTSSELQLHFIGLQSEDSPRLQGPTHFRNINKQTEPVYQTVLSTETAARPIDRPLLSICQRPPAPGVSPDQALEAESLP